MIKAGIIGGAGYTGGETIRLLLNHSGVHLDFVQSESQDGKKIYSVHTDCFGATELSFQREINSNVDVVFLCKGHGESEKFLKANIFSPSTKMIDLSQDFRHKNNSHLGEKKFIYGLPELNKEKIKEASNVANPGCFATCIQLALLPLASEQIIDSEIHVTATTGSTGAGLTLSATNHFSWRSNNLSSYKLLNHQHNIEITESLNSLQPHFNQSLNFVPQRGAFTRGIYSVAYLKTNIELEEAIEIYQNYYSKHPFTHITPFEIDVKQVVNTNNCFIKLQKEKDTLILISAIDNLIKGAAGQAIQNMNLMYGLEETTGLKLKPSAF